MFGPRSQLLCVLVCALLAASHVSAVTVNINHICALVSDGTLLANPSSCSTYYYCQNGVATQQTCTNNYFFSKDSQSCLPQSMVNCAQTGGNPCYGKPLGNFVPVTGVCAGYYYCGANGPRRGNCPGNSNFNAYSQKCVYSNQFPCGQPESGEIGDGTGEMGSGTVVSTINLCNYIKNGLYFGSADSCSSWNYCQNNVMSSGSCQNNMEYNVYIGRCDYPANVNCSQVTMDPLLSGASSTYGGACSVYGNTIKATACNKYYFCTGNVYQLMQCPNNEYYDPPSGTCVNRMMARNNCDRCVGSARSFVNSYSGTSCTGYLYCVNGVEQSSNNCQAGFYFNEIAGACVETTADPNFGCCNPNATGLSSLTPLSNTLPNPNNQGTTGNNGIIGGPAIADSQSDPSEIVSDPVIPMEGEGQ